MLRSSAFVGVVLRPGRVQRFSEEWGMPIIAFSVQMRRIYSSAQEVQGVLSHVQFVLRFNHRNDILGPQKYAKQWPFGLVVEALGCCFHTFGVQVGTILETSDVKIFGFGRVVSRS